MINYLYLIQVLGFLVFVQIVTTPIIDMSSKNSESRFKIQFYFREFFYTFT